MMNKNEYGFPVWIYRQTGIAEWDDLFERIEEALGFKLFIWQKTQIMGRGRRCSGETTAEILRVLVGETMLPHIYLDRPKSKVEDFYQRELIEIKRKLEAQGIKTRSVERRG